MPIGRVEPNLRPAVGSLPFNNLPGPLSPQDALRLPGDNIIKRIFWAIFMRSVLKQKVEEKLVIETIQQEELEERISIALQERKEHQHKLHHYVGREEGGQGHEEGFDAGEIDENYNGAPEAVAMYEESDKKKEDAKENEWIRKLIRIYYTTYLMIYVMLGMKRDEKGELSDRMLDDWLLSNQNRLEFKQLKMQLLSTLSANSVQLDLTQVEFVDRFVNRLTANLVMDGKTVEDVKALDQAELGKALSETFSQQMQAMQTLSHQMVQEVAQAVAAAGVQLKPAAPTPAPTRPGLKEARADLGAAAHHADLVQSASLQRLAAVKTMFPNVPKPQNTQRREHEKMLEDKHAHGKNHSPQGVAKFNTNEGLGNELQEYANAIGVDPRVLEQSADHTHMKVFGEHGPEHAAMHEAMRELTASPQLEAKSSAKASKAPRPTPPNPTQGS